MCMMSTDKIGQTVFKGQQNDRKLKIVIIIDNFQIHLQ